MPWICDNCGSNKIFMRVRVDYTVTNQGDGDKEYDKDFDYYHCSNCNDFSEEIENIAEWQEAQSE